MTGIWILLIEVSNISKVIWQQLKNGGFIDASFTPASGDAGTVGVVSTTTLTPGSNIPGSKTKNAGWIFDYVNSQNTVIVTAEFAGAGAAATTHTTAVAVGVILPVDALSMDTKLDDGVANTGKIRAHASTTDCNTSGVYDTEDSATQCALSFQVDPGL